MFESYSCPEPLWCIKDSWKVVAKDISKETNTLKTLNKYKVCNIPMFLPGDVDELPDQIIKTQDFTSAKWNRGSQAETRTSSKSAHIRYTTNLIGTHLTRFESSEKLIHAWLDALMAHEEAYTKCKILHRNIGLNSILITSSGSGLLNDWDLARTTKEIENGPRQPSRSGTWQFMSIDLLGKPNKKHELQDDLEAFFWVLLYVTIRFLHTSIVDSETPVQDVLEIIFDAAKNKGLQTVGGDSKQQVVSKWAHIEKKFHVKNNVPLSQLILDILVILNSYHQFYIALDAQLPFIVRRKKISEEDARVLYREENKDMLEGFDSHKDMIKLGTESLTQKWPTKEERKDYCDIPDQIFKSTKRTAPNDGVSGPDANKRLKTKH